MHIYAFPGLWAGPFMIGFGTASEQGEGKYFFRVHQLPASHQNKDKVLSKRKD
jgi:hypothetical protein